MADVTSTNQYPADALRESLRVVRERWLVVLALVVLTTASGWVASSRSTPQYKATAKLLFRNSSLGTSLLGSAVSQPSNDPAREAATNTELLASNTVATAVIRSLNLPLTPRQLLNKLEIATEGDADIASITVTDSNRFRAAKIANVYAQQAVVIRREADRAKVMAARTRLTAQLNSLKSTDGGQRAQIRDALDKLIPLEAVVTGNVEFADRALTPQRPASPHPKRDALLSGLFGLVLALGLAFVLERLDRRLKTPEELERRFGLAVVARIPTSSRGERDGGFAESFRMLAARLRFEWRQEQVSTLAVTSSSPQEGKSTVSLQLAIAAAEAGLQVLLVEADVYHPTLRRFLLARGAFNVPPRDAPGFGDLLAGQLSFDEVAYDSGLAGLRIVLAGTHHPDSMMPLLQGARFEDIDFAVRDLRTPPDLVIFDCPPLRSRADAVVVAAQSDAALFVVDLKLSAQRDIASALEALRSSAPVIGAVVNRDSDATVAPYSYGRGLRRTATDDDASRPWRSSVARSSD